MIATSLIKITFGMTLLRVAEKRVFPYTRKAIQIMNAVVVIQVVFFTFYTVFSCKPVSYLWGQLDPNKKGMRNSV
jgi:hypothetical protein